MRILIPLDVADKGSQKLFDHFADWLMQLGEGQLPSVEGNLYDYVLAFLPPAFCVNLEDDVINHVYTRLEICVCQCNHTILRGWLHMRF